MPGWSLQVPSALVGFEITEEDHYVRSQILEVQGGPKTFLCI